jgi:hypothetical protein
VTRSGAAFHSVSVSPTSQQPSHGMTKSRPVSVRANNPVPMSMADFGITMCTPFEERTFIVAVESSDTRSPVQAPSAVATCRALIAYCSPLSVSVACTPITRPSLTISSVALTRVAIAAPCASAVRANQTAR